MLLNNLKKEEREEIKDLKFDEFKSLVNFIKSTADRFNNGTFSITSVNESKNFIMKSMCRFFPELTALQEVELSSVIDNLDESEYNLFKEKYPNIYIDSTGKSEPRKKNYYEVRLETLATLYKFCKESKDDKFNKEIIEAKDLGCLKEKKYMGGVLTRKLLFSKPDAFIDFSHWKEYENFFKNFIGKQKADIFLGQILGYVKENKNKKNFVNNIVSRMDCLMLEQDKEKTIKHAENAQFLENINSVIETIIYKNNL